MTKESSLEQQIESLAEKLDSSLQQQINEEKFAEQANIRFTNNLTAFEKYYPEIAQAIKNYKTRDDFCLHVTQELKANFVKKGEKVPLYSDNPYSQCVEQVERNLNKPAISAVKYDFRKKKKDNRIHVKYMNKISELLANIREQKPDTLKQLPDRFPSAMIFGIGLGYHLEYMLDKVEFDYIHIVEPDFELFFASLFCIEWDVIIQRIDDSLGCLFIHLGISYENFFDSLYKVVQDIGAFSISKTFCYQHYPNKELNSLISNFFKQFYQFQNGFGFYNDAVTSIAHTIKHMNSNLPFWISDNVVADDVAEIPVFVVGNGPSLDSAEELLRQNKDNAIILAAGTALGSLLKMGIKPDFHVLIERPKRNYEILLETQKKEDYSDLNLLTTNVIYSHTPELYKWTGLAIKGNEAGSDYYALARIGNGLLRREIIPYSNPLVANTALSYASSFGFKNIYLIGVDNAITGSGEHHSKYSIYNDSSLKRQFKPLSGYDHEVEGNLGNIVYANNFYMVSKNQMELLIKHKPNSNYYNVGHGAKLKGAYPLTEEEVLIPSLSTDKNEVVEYIKNTQFISESVKDDDYQMLDLKAFSTIAKHIKDISQSSFSSRQDCLDILRRQSRYVYSLRGGRYSYYFQLFKGSLLYYHCPLITLLYRYEDDNLTLNWFKEGLDMWNEYLDEMEADFPESYDKPCDWGLE